LQVYKTKRLVVNGRKLIGEMALAALLRRFALIGGRALGLIEVDLKTFNRALKELSNDIFIYEIAIIERQ
jgi:hypothetical protein